MMCDDFYTIFGIDLSVHQIKTMTPKKSRFERDFSDENTTGLARSKKKNCGIPVKNIPDFVDGRVRTYAANDQ